MPITSTIQQGTLSLAAVTPGNSAIGDAAAAGTSASVARADHVHGREAFGTPVALSGTAANGSATTVARSDHQHGGTVAFPVGSASAPSITPVSDTDTGIWSPTANTLALSTGGSERVRVDSSGNLGIGTSSPTTALHVYTSAQSAAQVQSTNASGCNFTLDSISQDARYILAYNGSPKWYIANWQSQSNRMYIFDSSSAIVVYLAQGGTNWTSASDSRLKNVQGTITNALDKVQQLTGVKFTWKRDADNPDAKVRVGLIAQDVQAVLPEAVDDDSPDIITDEETGKVSGGLGVRYTELVPLLVNAIKELAMQHQLLQTRVAALEVQP